MRIGGLGISEAAKWGETPQIQMSPQKQASNKEPTQFFDQEGNS